MKRELTIEEAYNKAASRCSTTEYCVADICKKLTQWGLPGEAHREVVDHLLKDKYIDEARYSRAFVHDQYLYAHWGRVKIAQALKMKGIENKTIAASLEVIEEEEYDAILRDLLISKAKTTNASTPYERYGKLVRFALSRGFEMEKIQKFASAFED